MDNLTRMYLALLLLPHNALRARLQPELAACRDALALADDRSPQDVQDDYEAVVMELGKWLPGAVQRARKAHCSQTRQGAMTDKRDITERLAWTIARKSELDRDKDLMRDALKEIERLRAALKPFAEADWYARGNDRFDGIVSGSALFEAKLLTNG